MTSERNYKHATVDNFIKSEKGGAIHGVSLFPRVVDDFLKSGNGEAFRSTINDHSAMVNGFLNSGNGESFRRTTINDQIWKGFLSFGKGGVIPSFHQEVDSQHQHHTAGLTSDTSNYHYETKVDNFLKSGKGKAIQNISMHQRMNGLGAMDQMTSDTSNYHYAANIDNLFNSAILHQTGLSTISLNNNPYAANVDHFFESARNSEAIHSITWIKG